MHCDEPMMIAYKKSVKFKQTWVLLLYESIPFHPNTELQSLVMQQAEIRNKLRR